MNAAEARKPRRDGASDMTGLGLEPRIYGLKGGNRAVAPRITNRGDPVPGPARVERQFVTTIRSGVNPSAKVLDAEQMPWEFYANLTDEELLAIWQYLMSLNR